jgi:predicted Zn-dependent protease with MMP-like domain
MSPDWDTLYTAAMAEVKRTLDELPQALRERAEALPVTCERHPSRLQRKDGIEPDTLGLFVGPDYAEEGVSLSPIPPQIILFLENIWDFVEGDEEAFREEVHTTFMHELGHYLGLDEEGLFERGLE